MNISNSEVNGDSLTYNEITCPGLHSKLTNKTWALRISFSKSQTFLIDTANIGHRGFKFVCTPFRRIFSVICKYILNHSKILKNAFISLWGFKECHWRVTDFTNTLNLDIFNLAELRYI